MQMECGFHRKNITLICLLLAMAAAINVQGQGTRVGFYSKTCPYAECIVRSTVESYVRVNPALAAGLLRLHFHDCFVRGCDASVLIAGSGTERTAPPNDMSLRGFEVVDDAKAKLEAACPGVVSCADILALAARDSVVLTGGRHWQVPTGRRDGRVSIACEALASLPGPDMSVDEQRNKFAEKGLDLKDLVTLAGGHTLGTARCSTFSGRLYDFKGNGSESSDPSIHPSFLQELEKQCPKNGNGSTRVAMDTGSQNRFDKSYFANLKKGRGVFHSDQVLWTDASTKGFVQKYSTAKGLFKKEFGKSMIKMGNIGVMTGSKGEIRKVCSSIN